MSLLKEFSGIGKPKSIDLKRSDSSDAGGNDVVNKSGADEVGFSTMRNTINANGEITGSDVADYLERATELNDEVDTVPFGLETDDGDIVKVYVNAEEADKFEVAMKKLLGIEDDIEEAINKLALEFDIVDVVWPEDKEGDDGEEKIKPNDLDAAGEFDGLDDGDDEMDVVAEYDPLSSMAEGITAVDPEDQYVIKMTKDFRYTGTPGKKEKIEPRVQYFAGQHGRNYSWGNLSGAQIFDTMNDVAKMLNKIDKEDFEVYPNGGMGKAHGEDRYKIEGVLLSKIKMDEGQGVNIVEDDAANDAYTRLLSIVMNLSTESSQGVSAATGYDRKELTKREMISKFISEKYKDEAELVRNWMRHLAESEKQELDNILPFWLK